MLDLVDLYIKKNNLLDKSKKVVVSHSTGVDSTVLFDILYKLNYDIVIAHVNHNKRIESIEEMAYLKDFSNKLNIAFESTTLSLDDKSFEESARNERYKFFKMVAKKYNTNQIVTAHHLDDNLETILMKLSRGSNLYGYSGIKNKINIDGFIVSRPLLCVNKDMIYNYAYEFKLKYFEDYTNKLDITLRNKYRNHVIPLLKNEFKNISFKSSIYSNQLLQAFDYIRSQTMKLHDVTVSEFNNLHNALKYDYISYLLELNHINFNYEKLTSIINLLANNNPNDYLDIGNNKLFKKTYNNFKIEEKINKNLDELVIFEYGTYEFGDYVITFDEFITKNTQKYIRICYNNIVFPLKIRTRRNGDYINMPFGRKKVKDIFIDKKIPLDLRDQIPLVFDNKSLIGIPGIIQTKQDNFDCYLCFRRK